MSITSLPSPLSTPVAYTDPSGLATIRWNSASDIDQHVKQLQDWQLRYDQLDCGQFEGGFMDIRWPGVQIFVERTTRRIRQRGSLMPSSIGVGCLLEGHGDVAVNAIRAGLDSMLVIDSAELDICTPPSCVLAGVVIDSALLHDATQPLECALGVRPGSLVGMTPPPMAMARWREILTGATSAFAERPALLADAAVRDRLQGDLVSALIDAMCGASEHDQVFGQDQRKRVVDRACEMFLSRPDDPPTLAEVCHRVGASPRKLGYCFQDVLGLSPARYVKSIRLNAVRRELSSARGCSALSVYDVAARWGFWHFGHFSTDYKKHFAELPSETLRRARLSPLS